MEVEERSGAQSPRWLTHGMKAFILLAWLGSTAAETQTISAAPGTNTSSAQCAAQGLGGQCNSCVCCCYSGTSAFLNYQPTAQCTCKRTFNTGEIKLAAVLAVIVIVPTLLASCYFGGQLWVSPYKKEQRQNGDESPSLPSSPAVRHARRGSSLRPRTPPTLELTARGG